VRSRPFSLLDRPRRGSTLRSLYTGQSRGGSGQATTAAPHSTTAPATTTSSMAAATLIASRTHARESALGAPIFASPFDPKYNAITDLHAQ